MGIRKFSRRQSGSGKNEPKVASVLLEEFFQSNKPLAFAYRKWQVFPNTELDVDLKLLTHEPGRMRVGTLLNGVLARDSEEHFSFYEDALEKGTPKRNPHVFCGEFITVTRWSDGSYHPNFKPTKIGGRGFNLESYAFGVACELREALKGLIEEEMCE